MARMISLQEREILIESFKTSGCFDKYPDIECYYYDSIGLGLYLRSTPHHWAKVIWYDHQTYMFSDTLGPEKTEISLADPECFSKLATLIKKD